MESDQIVKPNKSSKKWRLIRQSTEPSNGSAYEYEDADLDEMYGRWIELPDMLLEEILALIIPKYRHEASQVCRRWHQTFYATRVWETFTLLERTLTKKTYSMYKGWTRELCGRKAQVCFLRVGSLFKRIVITPLSDFYNLYEFLRVLNCFFVFYDHFPMPLLHTFEFTFACEIRELTGVSIYGTGGQILDILKAVVGNMKNLKHLKLNDLLLDVNEVAGLVEAVLSSSRDCLRTFELLNCSKIPHPIPELAQFTNLSRLTVSAQHLDEESLLMIGGIGLAHLSIVQDPYTCEAEPVSSDAWKLVKEMAPKLRVTLEIRGSLRKTHIIQPYAPVSRIKSSSPYSTLTPEFANKLVMYYHKTMEVFDQRRLPRLHGSRSFHDRSDSSFVFLLRRCPRIHTLIIRERISTATLLLLMTIGKNLKNVLVRRNALIKKSDWPKADDWSPEFYQWLKTKSRSYDDVSAEVSKILGYPWRPLRDEEFKFM
ncbi:uncharacterized protein LOC121376197 [Gigantopelta aegis]|uniref:uncharacterized protein LOC121376197 n=1 Tax=Gigantopelta aegis TaxID=1735272 RepID=UPI001B887ED2|nr:uncharacterized protein LOC121376197 [Gigantopelta aegis]